MKIEAVLTRDTESKAAFAELRSPRRPSSEQSLDNTAVQRTHAGTTFYARDAEQSAQGRYERF